MPRLLNDGIPVVAILVIVSGFYRQMRDRKQDPMRLAIAEENVTFRSPVFYKRELPSGRFGPSPGRGLELVVRQASFQVSYRNDLLGRIFGREWYCRASSVTIRRDSMRVPPGVVKECIIAESSDPTMQVKRVAIFPLPVGGLEAAWQALVEAGVTADFSAPSDGSLL
jgi:hypothetical protein